MRTNISIYPYIVIRYCMEDISCVNVINLQKYQLKENKWTTSYHICRGNGCFFCQLWTCLKYTNQMSTQPSTHQFYCETCECATYTTRQYELQKPTHLSSKNPIFAALSDLIPGQTHYLVRMSISFGSLSWESSIRII